jgi:CRP-like cAMP-binding protein
VVKRVRDYYKYLHKNTHIHNDEEYLAELPKSLQSEIRFCLSRHLLAKCTVFADVSGGCLLFVVQRLRPEVYLPGDYIVVQGEKGGAMYFIEKGEAIVVSERAVWRSAHSLLDLGEGGVQDMEVGEEIEEIVLATLPPGSCFGEQSLIFNEARSASVKSSTYTSVMTLSRECFEESAASFPELRNRMHELGTIRKQKRKDAAAKWSGATLGVITRDYSAAELVLALKGNAVFPNLAEIKKKIGAAAWELLSAEERRQAVVDVQAVVMARAQGMINGDIADAGTPPVVSKLTAEQLLARVTEQLTKLTVDVQLLSQEQNHISGEVAAVHRRVAMQSVVKRVMSPQRSPKLPL